MSNFSCCIETFAPTETPSGLRIHSTTEPTVSPSSGPTVQVHPTHKPTPTVAPITATKTPTVSPTNLPTFHETEIPTAQPSSLPSAVPSLEPSYFPSVSPSKKPSIVPTKAPTRKPTEGPTVTPTRLPTFSPTTLPTAAKTVRPSQLPSPHPTNSPSIMPTRKPNIVFVPDSYTPGPTVAPETETGCMDAWVWCPSETSTCFADSNFNGNTPGQGWGWSIDVDGESGLNACSGCQIWANSNCDRTAGTMVGTADFEHHYATVSLKNGYALSSASMYGGGCEGSDGGDVATNHCTCKPNLVAEHANDYDLFPIQKTFDPFLPGYTFAHHDLSTTAWGGEYYPVFPLGAPHRKFVSVHLKVCPCPSSH